MDSKLRDRVLALISAEDDSKDKIDISVDFLLARFKISQLLCEELFGNNVSPELVFKMFYELDNEVKIRKLAEILKKSRDELFNPSSVGGLGGGFGGIN